MLTSARSIEHDEMVDRMRASHVDAQDRPGHDSGGRHRRHARSGAYPERRAAFLLLTICLSLATGVALLGAGAALTGAAIEAPISGPATPNAQLVRDFYAAVNDAIRTGDADALDMFATSDLAWCIACSPGQPPTREGLKDYLTDLHRTAPAARLVVDAVVAGYEETVTVHLRSTGFPTVGEPPPWGPVDTLRLAGGLIAERRGGPAGVALVEPLLRTQFDRLPPAMTSVTLARLTFLPGSGATGLLSTGPTLLVVESGSLTVRIAGGGRILRVGGEETSAGKGLGLATVLHAGDAAIIPPGVRHQLGQHGSDPAVAVGATLIAGDEGSDRSPPRGPEFAPFLPPDAVLQDAAPAQLPTVRILAGGTVEKWPAGPVTVAMGRTVLGPGASAVPPPDETALLAVEAGTLDLVGAGAEEATVAAGAGLVRPAGAAYEVRNAGTGPLVLLVVTVAPVWP